MNELTQINDELQMPEVVYFMRAGNFVKIGKSTYHPRARMAQLQTGCPYQIELMGFIFGGTAREARLHSQFQHLRACGEWFCAERELLICIEALLDSHREWVASDIKAMRREQEMMQQYSDLQCEHIELMREKFSDMSMGRAQ